VFLLVVMKWHKKTSCFVSKQENGFRNT
jgi:hypothetical protein